MQVKIAQIGKRPVIVNVGSSHVVKIFPPDTGDPHVVDFAYDSFNYYPNGVRVDGLNRGINWSGSYNVTPEDELIANDDFESYSSGSSVNGLNGGTGWNGAYITT